MTALSEQLRPADLAPPGPTAARARQTRRAGGAARWPALAAGFTAFACMLPYPAHAVGNATALQLGNVCLAAACLPLLWTPWRGRPFHVYLILLSPLALSTLMTAISGGEASLAFKAMIVWGMSLLALSFVQLYAPRFALQMLSGIAVAALLHAVVGLWQTYAFARDYFPLVEIYRNPSFLSVQENAQTIARWTKRPFGIFPEPSAMSASLTPWLLIWVAVLGGVIRLRQQLTGHHRALFLAAAAGTVMLMIVSRSGQTAVTLLAALLLCGLWLLRARATPRTFGLVMAAFGLVLPLVCWLAVLSVGDRLGGAALGNSSWAERAYSIRSGLALFAGSDLATLLFGFGPGLSSFAITQRTGLEAIWSISLCYAFDTGLVGVVMLSWLALLLVKNWARVRYDLAFIIVMFAWTVGITLTTSYEQLLPLWMALGWFTVWPETVAPVEPLAQPPAARPPGAVRTSRDLRATLMSPANERRQGCL